MSSCSTEVFYKRLLQLIYGRSYSRVLSLIGNLKNERTADAGQLYITGNLCG